jgi:hypothetical protein
MQSSCIKILMINFGRIARNVWNESLVGENFGDALLGLIHTPVAYSVILTRNGNSTD